MMADSRPQATGAERAANIQVPPNSEARQADSADANRSGRGALEHQHVRERVSGITLGHTF